MQFGLKKIATALVVAVVLFFFCRWLENFFLGSAYLERNYNFVFGLLLKPLLIFIFSAIAVVSVGYYYFRFFRSSSFLFSVGFGLFLGGGFSNLYSRAILGYVNDYIRLRAGAIYGTWNAADFFIVFSIILMMSFHRNGNNK